MRCRHILTVTVLAVALSTGVAHADVPQLINYQGILLNSLGEPITDPASVLFAIWNAGAGGDSLWSEVQIVDPDDDGRFSVLLGSVSPIPDSAFTADAYLSLKVESDPEMSPRQQIVSVAYAYRVNTVDGASGGTIGGELDVTGMENKIRFHYSTFADLPDPVAYHGMFAHVHNDAKTYYAHAGAWVPIANEAHSHSVTSADVVDETLQAIDIDTGAVASSEISDGSIGLVDIGQNGAAAGQVMKWDGAAWNVADDDIGGGSGSGWVDDGALVRLETLTDSVGIGTITPGEKLQVVGNILTSGSVMTSLISIGGNEATITGDSGKIEFDNANVIITGRATIGPGNINTGVSSLVAGEDNSVNAGYATVAGGRNNLADNYYSFVGAGRYNKARGLNSVVVGGGSASEFDSNSAFGDYSAVVGGRANTATGYASHIGGGLTNLASEAQSSIGGGQNNTASGIDSRVGGGTGNSASGVSSTVAGGGGNMTSGDRSVVAGGASNTANNSYATVAGGSLNTASGSFSAIGGGRFNNARGQLSVVAGGGGTAAADSNTALGDYSAIGGGSRHVVSGDYSTVVGGRSDTIDATADYSYLFGIGSRMTQDSTFMVDMPHIRFGDESTGFEFPSADGSSGQVMSTDGSGQLSWVDPVGGAFGWTDDGTVVRLDAVDDSVGIGTSAPSEKLDVVGNIHASGTITSGNSISIDGEADRITASSGTLDFDDEDITTTGKATIGPANTNAGTNAFVAGSNNTASGDSSFIGGGSWNIASGVNASVCGGFGDTASGIFSVIGGGRGNRASGAYSAIGGGQINSAIGERAAIGGGISNTAGGVAAIAGGVGNEATGYYSTISGGYHNDGFGWNSTIAGGWLNVADGDSGATIGGGFTNTSGGDFSTVGGGRRNKSRGQYSVVSGGGGASDTDSNSALGDYSSIGGGRANAVTAIQGTIAGGRQNTANGGSAFIGGGYDNTSGPLCVVGGGTHNTASDTYATVGGGWADTASAYSAAVVGGYQNKASGSYSNVSGGYFNLSSGDYSTVAGGFRNAAVGDNCAALGVSAKANHAGSIVLAANSDQTQSDSIRSGGSEQMVLRADGGLYLTNTAELAPYDATNIITTRGGAYLSGNGTTWTNSSDKAKKENFANVDRAQLLAKIAKLPIMQWNYKEDDATVKHIGPVAQDFYALFNVGCDDKSISTIDPAGIALAAIQELHKQNSEQKKEITELKAQIEELHKLLQTLVQR